MSGCEQRFRNRTSGRKYGTSNKQKDCKKYRDIDTDESYFYYAYCRFCSGALHLSSGLDGVSVCNLSNDILSFFHEADRGRSGYGHISQAWIQSGFRRLPHIWFWKGPLSETEREEMEAAYDHSKTGAVWSSGKQHGWPSAQYGAGRAGSSDHHGIVVCSAFADHPIWGSNGFYCDLYSSRFDRSAIRDHSTL